MAYKTECPHCENPLEVYALKATVSGMMLGEDGFSPGDARSFCTEDEWVRCTNDFCSFDCELSELDMDLWEGGQDANHF